MAIKTCEAPIMLGTTAERTDPGAPAEAIIPVGTLYFETDTKDLYILEATAWVKVNIVTPTP